MSSFVRGWSDPPRVLSDRGAAYRGRQEAGGE